MRKVLDLDKDNATLRQQLKLLQTGAHEQQQRWHCSSDVEDPRHAAQLQQHNQDQHQEVQHLQCEVQRLRQQCKTAWQQVAEIKAFLQDYGLVWVGDTPPADTCPSPTSGSTAAAALPPGSTAVLTEASSSIYQASSSLPFDIAELQQCIDELNAVAGDGISQLRPINTAAVASGSNHSTKTIGLYTPEPVQLVIYSNGMQLHTAPARPYTDATTEATLIDIFDGYFPSVLRHEFPEGIPLKLVDRSSVSIATASASATAGQGASATHHKIRGFEQLQQQCGSNPAGVLGPAEFLQRLPNAVVKNQQVVPVRSAVQDYLQGSNNDSRSSSSAGRVYIRAHSGRRRSKDDSSTGSIAQQLPGEQQQQQQLATVQVKSADGKQTFVLKLAYQTTIGMLRALIDRHQASTGMKCTVCEQKATAATVGTSDARLAAGAAAHSIYCYELRSAFPARAYDDDEVTLEAAGLTPSATLFMKHC